MRPVFSSRFWHDERPAWFRDGRAIAYRLTRLQLLQGVFVVLNAFAVGSAIALVVILQRLFDWRKKMIPTLQDPRGATFVTRDYTSLPIVHATTSIVAAIVSPRVILDRDSASTQSGAFVAMFLVALDTFAVPYFLIQILPSPKTFEGCQYWLTLPGQIPVSEAAYACHLLSGPLYVLLISGLLTVIAIALMWILLLWFSQTLVSTARTPYALLPSNVTMLDGLGAAFDVRAESNADRDFAAITGRDGHDEDVELISQASPSSVAGIGHAAEGDIERGARGM